MARARNIKPGFFLNDKLAECDPLARQLFAGLRNRVVQIDELYKGN